MKYVIDGFLPPIDAQVRLFFIHDESEMVGKICSTPYIFNDGIKFAFLPDGAEIKGMLSIRWDAVVVRKCKNRQCKGGGAFLQRLKPLVSCANL